MHLSKRFLPVAALAALLAAPMAARAESDFSVVLQGGVTKYNRSLASGSDVGAEYGPAPRVHALADRRPARFQYNYLLTDQLFRTQNGNVTTGHNTDFYGVSVDVGASFR
jgi:hypothetical protein